MKNIVHGSSSTSSNLEKEDMGSDFVLGNWFWVKDDDEDEIEDGYWFGCLTEIGSNFVKISLPYSQDRGGYSVRIHFDDVYEWLKYEPSPKAVIQQYVNKYQTIASSTLNEIKAISARLGVSLQPSISVSTKTTGQDLMIFNGQTNVDDHKRDLIKAKEFDLPKLFEDLKKNNAEVARWLSAESLPLQAIMSEMKESLGAIDDRIFNVSLYAGLTETAIKCCDGKPADFHERLHVMQRRLYMDEESLLDYKSGGLEFKSIRAYDKWISKPKNRDRILPFPRCLIAMRVRRHTKERESDCLSDILVNMDAKISDKYTYLYVRNGEQIFRLICDVEFDEMIFPDSNKDNRPLMVRMFATSFQESITRDEYDSIVAEKEANEKLCKKWELDNPRNKWERDNPRGVYHWANPYYDKLRHFNPRDWSPFDSSNIYFDDCKRAMDKRIKHYNHVALIIQGLFDRTEVLHPHPPVRTWEPESFNAMIKLVYDSSNVLNYREAPDFEVYRNHCNAMFTAGSISVGQQDFWERKEAEKECRRRDNDWRDRGDYRPKKFRPYGNPGMGYVATVHKWNPRTKVAEFRWYRDRIRDASPFHPSKIETKISIPAEHVFNISAYKKGDYLQFFQDPRTREKYLKWAPLLMAAEDYVTAIDRT